jgi:MYXO-CTERM domain-containing protein
VIGTASATASAGFEYYRDETVKLQGRVRATSLDPGAFESTTNSTPFDGNSEPTDGGAGGPGGGGSGLGPPTGGSGGTPTSGCGCSFAGSTPPTLALLLAAGLLTWVSRRRRRR